MTGSNRPIVLTLTALALLVLAGGAIEVTVILLLLIVSRPWESMGRDAVNVASAFAEKISLDGVILTKLDGDARGGAALAVKAVTGVPIKFLGTGETVGRL